MFRDKSLIGLNLAVFLMMLGVGMIVALLPQRIINLTGSSVSVGYLASAFAVSYIMFQIPIGNLSDKIGFKIFIASGYLLCSITGMLFYFSNSANFIFLGRFIQGIGEAPIWALAPALLSIKYPSNKGKAMGIYNAIIHLGLTVGPILGVLLAKLWPGNQAFLFYSVVCFLGAFVIFYSVDNAFNQESQKEIINFNKILSLISNKEILITLVGITLYGSGYGIFLTILPAFLINYKGFTSTQIGLFFSFFYMAISLSQIITGPLSDKFGRKIFMIIGLVIASTGVYTFLSFSQPLTILILLTSASLGLGIFYLSSMAFLNDNVPDSLKGTISGAYYLFWGVGMFLGPILIGVLMNLSSNLGFIIYSILLSIEVLIMLIYRRRNSSPRKSITGNL
jgi:MFS family permease